MREELNEEKKRLENIKKQEYFQILVYEPILSPSFISSCLIMNALLVGSRGDSDDHDVELDL